MALTEEQKKRLAAKATKINGGDGISGGSQNMAPAPQVIIYQEAPKKKKSKWWIAIVVILVIGAFGAAGNRNKNDSGSTVQENTTTQRESSDANTGTPANADNQVSEEKAEEIEMKEFYTVGETAEVNGVQMTLANAGIVSEENLGYMTPDDGKEYVMFEFEIYNGSNSDITMSSLVGFEAYCDDYSINEEALMNSFFEDKKSSLDGTVAVGKRMTGAIYYQVPMDFGRLEVKVSPSFWSKKSATFVYENSAT